MKLLADILNDSIPELRNQKLHPVTVAVVDSGIDSTHETLKNRISSAWEFVEENGEIVSRQMPAHKNNDDAGHGTAVASVICRLAPNTKIIDFKVLNAKFAGSGKIMLKGFEAAIESEAQIINMSLACLSKYKVELEDLCERAYRKHKIVIASKRNVPKENDLGFPAELATCISVDNKTYSNPFFLEHIDEQPIEFAAHGESVLVAKNGGGYYRLTGTSFATPTVSGITALLLGKYPDLEMFEIKSILKYHSRKATYKNAALCNPLETAEHTSHTLQDTAGYFCPQCKKYQAVHAAFSYVRCNRCSYIFPLSSFLDKKLYQEVLQTLDHYVPKNCYYHNRRHTQEVVANTHMFMQHYSSLSNMQRKCLMTAALLHDYGYCEQYHANEPVAARYARELLPIFGYTEREIDLICSLILATTMPVNPKNLLEKIICDADVAHIGLPPYWKKSQLLRKERRAHGFKDDPVKYCQAELAFLEHHRYFQHWLEKERKAGRDEAIRELKAQLKKNRAKRNQKDKRDSPLPPAVNSESDNKKSISKEVLMTCWKKLSASELEKLTPDQIHIAAKAGEDEISAQEIVRCPECGSMLIVTDTPQYVSCGVCNETFNVSWF